MKWLQAGALVVASVGATGGYAVTELNAMKAELRQAVQQVSALKAQKQRVKRKVGERRQTVAARKLKRAERKIGRAAVSMVPYAGIAVIVSSAALEVDELCNDIEEMKAFELNLFREDPLPQEDPSESRVCGLDVENELKPIAEEQLQEVQTWWAGKWSDIEAVYAEYSQELSETIPSPGDWVRDLYQTSFGDEQQEALSD